MDDEQPGPTPTADPSEPRTDVRPARRWARRLVFVGLIVVQLALVVRAYRAPHMEFGYQMFPEASEWSAEIVRVTADGRRIPIESPWFGYEWNELVGVRGLTSPWRRDHADAGVDNQLQFLAEALDWVAANTPSDDETMRLEADVTVWRNMGGAEHLTITVDRELP